jgi:hypothetical protein
MPPRVRDDRDTPWDEMAGNIAVIWVAMEAEHFAKLD